MMKLILLAFAFIALLQPSVQLTCYECKSKNYQSSYPEFNHPRIKICDEDQKKWPTQNTTRIDFDVCKKIVEKVKLQNEEVVLVIRTIGEENMKLDNTFTQYSCKEDLCNSGVTLCATAYAAVLSIMVTLMTNF